MMLNQNSHKLGRYRASVCRSLLAKWLSEPVTRCRNSSHRRGTPSMYCKAGLKRRCMKLDKRTRTLWVSLLFSHLPRAKSSRISWKRSRNYWSFVVSSLALPHGLQNLYPKWVRGQTRARISRMSLSGGTVLQGWTSDPSTCRQGMYITTSLGTATVPGHASTVFARPCSVSAHCFILVLSNYFLQRKDVRKDSFQGGDVCLRGKVLILAAGFGSTGH